MSRPVVGLQVSGPVPAGLDLLVRSLATRWEFRADAPASWDALLVSQPAGAEVAGPPGRPFALWCPTLEHAGTPGADRAAVLLHDGALDALPAARVVRISPRTPGLSATGVGTELRARLRQARGLPAAPVLTGSPDGWRWQGRLIAEAQLATAMACAAAVVTTDPTAVLRALSWGAPVVTSASAAAAVGATHDVQLRVGATEAARQVAGAELAADRLAAARLGRAGRQHVEQRADLDRSLDRLALLLRLQAGAPPLLRTSALLDQLSTPLDAAIRDRVALALAPLRQPVQEAAVLPDALSAPHTQALEPAAVPTANPAAANGPSSGLRRIVKGVLRRLIGLGAAPLLRELRANRAELARLQAEVAVLRLGAADAGSTAVLAAELTVLKAQVAGLLSPASAAPSPTGSSPTGSSPTG